MLVLAMIFFFLDVTPKTQTTKAKINTWDYINLKCFCTGKKTLNRMKRQSTEWEKIFANHMSDEGLISKIHKECMQHNSNNNNSNLILKWAKDLNIFPKRIYKWPTGT